MLFSSMMIVFIMGGENHEKSIVCVQSECWEGIAET